MKWFPVCLAAVCLVLLLGFPLDGYCFFTASEISLVKDTPIPGDKSITFGKLLGSYKYCKDGKWEVKKTNSGQTIVEFRGRYLNIGLVESLIKRHFSNDSGEIFKKIAEHLDSSNFKIDFVASFLLKNDGKSIVGAFLGFDYGGNLEIGRAGFGTNPVESILKNVPLSGQETSDRMPGTSEYDFYCYALDYILKRNNLNKIIFAQTLNHQQNPSDSPIVLVTIKNTVFNKNISNKRQSEIQADAECKIVDITPAKLLKVGIKIEALNQHLDLNKIKIEEMSYKTIQTSNIKLNIWPKGFVFVSLNSENDEVVAHIRVTKLDPFTFITRGFRYEGEISEETQKFISAENARNHGSHLAEQNAEKERRAIQAYEGSQASPHLRNEEPYTGPGSKVALAETERKTQEKEAREKEARAAMLGTYINKTNGTLILSESKEKENVYDVTISTINRLGKQCNFGGECTPAADKNFVCKISKDKKGGNIKLSVSKDVITLSDFEYAVERFCGNPIDYENSKFKKTSQETVPSNVAEQAHSSKEAKVSPGVYAYAEEGLTGELMLYVPYDQKSSPNPKYNITIATTGMDGNTCDFEGECIIKGGKLICSNADFLEEDEDNFIEIDIKNNYILDITKTFTGPCGTRAYINGIYKPKCIDKVLGTKTVSGIYLGWFESEEGVNTIGIKVTGSNEDLYIVASQEEADSLFGKAKGQKISVTYDVEQAWIDNACGTLDILKTGKVLQ